MNLEESILDLLANHSGLKAKEIADKLGNRYTKSEINSILYGPLKVKVEQDKSYKWRIRKPSEVVSVTFDNLTQGNTDLSKIVNYYLECISKDNDSGISTFASSKFDDLDYGQLNKIPFLHESTTDLNLISKLVAKVRNNRNGLILKFGYPVYLKRLISRANVEFYKVEPVFLLNIDTDYLLATNKIRITDEDPVLNPEFVKSMLGSSGSEVIQELVLLNEELGINNTEEKPSLEDLSQRLALIREEWDWKEVVDPYELTSVDLRECKNKGVYNVCGVFKAERSQYTVGLEKELTDMSAMPEAGYHGSALGNWLNKRIEPSSTNFQTLLEPMNLNEEQRVAVLRGLGSSLTVITGPPGTGKSQVVASLLINAVYKKQKVLFASKNHKAVDVVYERVNGLTSKPVMLRIGNNQLQSELATYLTSLLSSTTSMADTIRWNQFENRHNLLSLKVSELRAQQEKYIKRRNIIDNLDDSLEYFRSQIDQSLVDFYDEVKSLDINNCYEKLQELESCKEKLDRSKQPFITRLFWGRHRKVWIVTLMNIYSELQKTVLPFKLVLPGIENGEIDINKLEELITLVHSWISNINNVTKYFEEFEQLSKSENLYQLSLKDKHLTEEIAENSMELWQSWLQMLPSTITNNQRTKIGDYIAVLNLIVQANSSNLTPDSKVWSKYYKLLPEITSILSCWAVTSLSVKGRVPFEPGFFDLVVIDEASQCDIASALPLLYRAKRAVIIGDDKQLTHISTINESQDIQLLEKYKLDEDYMGWSYTGASLFRLATSLCNSDDIVVLRDHHRSHADIINYSNKFFYNNNLRIATNYEKLQQLSNEPVVRWIDVAGSVIKPSTGGALNEAEAQAVVNELKRVIATGYSGTIGVVSPFKAQANRIKDIVAKDQQLVESLLSRQFLVDTVHKFQGDERDIIIFSTVVGAGISPGALLFLSRTGNLFNVAITRARASLIVVGDMEKCLNSNVEHFKNFVEYIKKLDGPNKTLTTSEEYDMGPEYPKLQGDVYVSDWEKLVYEALYKEGIYTIPQYKVDQYSLDLAFIWKGRKLDIEIDGERYHRNWDGELLKRDHLRNKRLIELGWDVKRFWVYEVRDDLQGCVDMIKTWMKSDNQI